MRAKRVDIHTRLCLLNNIHEKSYSVSQKNREMLGCMDGCMDGCQGTSELGVATIIFGCHFDFYNLLGPESVLNMNPSQFNTTP